MQDHRKIRAYQAAQELARDVYQLTQRLPVRERYGLADQMHRAAVSIGSNIVEGSGRATQRDFCSFLDKALGSAREIEFQLGHAQETGLLPSHTVTPALARSIAVQRMLTSLIVKIRSGKAGGNDGEQ
jgi:four helix bundle protein